MPIDRASLIFCVLSVVISVGLAWLVYPLAAISPETIAASKQATDAENIPELDLGDFGVVSVEELLGYYIENPPAPKEAGSAPERAVRFSGC